MTAHITIDPEWVSEATGMIAVVAIVIALIASARVKSLTRSLGIGSVYGVHRALGVLAVAMVGVHIAAVLTQKWSNYQLLLPWSGTSASKAADVSTAALVVLISSAMWRRRRDYDRWRRWHFRLTVATVVGATLHVVLLRHLIEDMMVAVWFAVVGCIAIAALIHRWVWRPLNSGVYMVAGVHAESPTVSTVTLMPRQGRHRPNRRLARFAPGQFGWLRLSRNPKTDHPYSFSSSAHDAHRVQVTVKRGGKFTERLVHTRPGQPVWVDGPHGGFTPPDNAVGLVLIAAGVGITPMMSMLRTCADRRDRRPIRLIHVVDTPAEFVFHQEITRLTQVLNLQVIPVVSRKHPDWRGRTGHIDLMLLDQVLPGQPVRSGLDYFLCGPPSMVSDTETALVLAGVARSRIHTERFFMPTPKGKTRAKHSRPPVDGAHGRFVRDQSGGGNRDGGPPNTVPFPVVPD